ncbi:zinc-binding alcohol dehydrogenase family protein [Bacillus daqingensis]|uniref:Zinc-binding alcohol dehydrogenase family protein n=1 Tax=Bacillus daqingensis TaxID=872396 RepID=A0ABV9NWY9_9BACI
MKAVQIETFGSPDVLAYKELDTPVPGEQEVLIDVTAIGVNFADTMRRQDAYVVDTPLPFIPGSEVVGTVSAKGSGVSDQVQEGQRVAALIGEGAYAEQVTAHEKTLIPVPENLSDEEAAALPLQGLSAYHIIHTMGRLEAGETILIHAAAGGVGTLAVQLAKEAGAGTIIATASTEKKRQTALDLGADHAVDYTKDNWKDEVLKLTGDDGVDVALEMAGGSIFHDTLEILAPFGRLVFFGAASGELPEFSPFSLLEKNKSVIGFFLPQMMARPKAFQESLETIMRLAAEGKLKLTIGGTYPLREAASLHEDMENRRTSGKMILTP